MDRFDAVCLALYRRYLARVVGDPETRAGLTPNFGPVAKRPTLSNGYLRAYNRANVALVTTPIEKITPTGVRTADSTLHRFDALILATGYEVFSDPETYRPGTVLGRNGFDLAKFYNEGVVMTGMADGVGKTEAAASAARPVTLGRVGIEFSRRAGLRLRLANDFRGAEIGTFIRREFDSRAHSVADRTTAA